MGYVKSLLKYVVGVIIFLGLFTGLQLALPQGEIEVTYNQALVGVIIGIIVVAIGLKVSVDNR